MERLINIILPQDQLEGTEAKLSHWLAECGTMVKEGDPILELETDKVSMEVCAPGTGYLQEICKFPGDDIEPGIVLGKLSTDATPDKIEAASPEGNLKQTEDLKTKTSPNQGSTKDLGAHSSREVEDSVSSISCDSDEIEDSNSARHLLGPAVRRQVRENNLDIDLIEGSGRKGRVTRDDVIAYIKTSQAQSGKAGQSLKSTEIPHTPMRKAIAKHMVESLLHTAPHVTSVFEMDMSNVIEHRRWHKQEFLQDDCNLTFTAYFLAATVRAMKAVPQMNARYHEHALELFKDINIGVGTAMGDKGLVVPVVREVQNKSLLEIAKALQAQTEKARSGKLVPADMKNGTFTISNHGVSGSLLAAPIIINQPQVAILGVGKLEKRVVVREVKGEESIVIKPMCYVSLSIDHRAVDAFQTNLFLQEFVSTIEQWGNYTTH